jgi:hypothetical protein
LVRGKLGACVGQGQLTTAAREMTRYKLDLVGVQEVRWDKRGNSKRGGIRYLYVEGEMVMACSTYEGTGEVHTGI